MREVARQANVSVATVSRALNAPALVAAETASAVLEAVRALDFRPNLAGRSLRAGRTKIVGVVLPTLTHPVFAECLHSIETAARERDHVVSIATTGYEAAREHEATEILLQHRVDGLIVTVADARRSRVLDKLDRQGVPYVLVYNESARDGRARRRPSVSVDNRAAARQVVEHLIALGHRRILMVAGSVRQSDRSRLRAQGYADALKAAAIAPLAPIELPFMASDARLQLADALHRRPRPSALFCSSDQLALLVMRDLAALGLRVPADISVAGFDGTAVSALTVPSLTTVVQPSLEIGRAAFDLLLGMLDGAQFGAPAVLHHTLRVGGTCAAPSQ